jgi:hypothetical protein
MKNNSNGRLLAQTCSYRPFQENYDEVMEICRETGLKPAEVLRDALDEWLLMRRTAATGNEQSLPDDRQSDREEKIEELQHAIRQLDQKLEKLAKDIDYSQQRDHGYLLEIFQVAYGTRDLIWRSISTRMRDGKQTPESIQGQYEAFEREWNEQTNVVEDMIREAIRKGSSNAQA